MPIFTLRSTTQIGAQPSNLTQASRIEEGQQQFIVHFLLDKHG